MKSSILGHLNNIYHNSLTTEKLLTAFNQNENRKLAGLGDSILDLILKELVYKNQESTPEDIDDVRKNYANKSNMKEILDNDLVFETYLKDEHGCTSPIGKFRKERCDAYIEATIAAIYYDKGYNTATKFVLDVFEIR